MYLTLWIINPLLRSLFLSTLVRRRIATNLWVLHIYLSTWVIADITMALLWHNQVARYYAQQIFYALFYFLQLLIAIGCINTLHVWHPLTRLAVSWSLMMGLLLSTGYVIGTRSWLRWERYSGWCDLACWFLILAYLVWEPKRVWPYSQIMRGLGMMVVGNGLLQWLQGEGNPGPGMRMMYQAVNTVGLVYWLVSMRQGRKPKSLAVSNGE